MGKSKLEKRLEGSRRMVVACLVVIAVLGAILVVAWRDAERVETAWIAGQVDAAKAHAEEPDLGKVRILDWSTPTPEPELVSDALAVATLNNYANLEASRIAKMAAVLMDMGGAYRARCETVYRTATDKIETEYRLEWNRSSHVVGIVSPDGTVPGEIKKVWRGASWAECIQAMLAWKGGE